MKLFTAVLLSPVSMLVVVLILLIELVWLPGVSSKILDARVAEVSRSIHLAGEALKLSPSTSQQWLPSLNIDAGEDISWRKIFLISPHTNETQLIPPTEYASGARFISYPVENSQLIVGAWVDSSAVLLQAKEPMRRFEMAILLWGIVLSVLFTLLQRQMLFKPLKQLIREVDEVVASNNITALEDSHVRGVLLEPLIGSLTKMCHAITKKCSVFESTAKQSLIDEERLNKALDIARLGCWEWILKEERFWYSDSLTSILLIKDHQQLNLESFISGVHPADRSEVVKKLRKMRDDAQSVELCFRVSASSGEYRHIQLLSSVVLDNQGQVSRICGTCQDITEHKSIEASLKKLSSAITHSGSSVLITDVIGAIEYVNPKYTETTGYLLSDVVGQQPELLSRKLMKPDCYEALWQSLLSGRHWRGELRGRKKDSSTFWSLVSISPINNEYGELTHFVIVCEDVTELKDAHARMERLALYDELTGLPNRRFFFSELSRLFEQDVIEHPSVVMLLDLDFFKTVNDTQGHSAGDRLLIEVAQRLVGALQDGDIAARLGGDEFAILINPVLDVEHIEVVAQSILNEISRPFYINEHELQISTSLGLAWLPKDGNTPEALLKHADLAMYQAKEMGRNQYRFFTESLHDQLQAYIRFSREMPKALETNSFILEYQPQVSLKTGNIIGVEALVRWDHPELGIVSPQRFISVAEETGFIVPLGRWVLKTACKTLKHLALHQMSHIKVAINLSSRQFRDPNLLTMIRQMLLEYDVDPARLELEITESLLMHDIGLAIETLKELQALGITIAIDDFGIGYSSFNYLKTLPINVLKVDREFIKDIPDHLDDMEITAAMISMAHRLGMIVVAEGIETQVQQVFLEEHHCDIGQGYLFSRPIELSKLMGLLTNQEAK
ncbi:putative bifunctional diguanylate cyclase/phosphodiesterase [Neptunomonas japonica]|uniref:putative bifunctional diguanylate cyclase/phosphodiesterase n=1 Tax=Neptunomonas japonica TaxID=417574 RepID=UPI00042A1BA7|nr:GGDEF domain-containing phosphodiesterase [Neptunomonas japonica]